jgi:hypothetical protein
MPINVPSTRIKVQPAPKALRCPIAEGGRTG